MSFPQLSELLPAGAAACAVQLSAADADRVSERFPDIPIPPHVAAAVPKRRLHYAAGRHCARVALERLGFTQEIDLPADAHNVLRWPDGIVGSISHTDDVACAAVASTTGSCGLGIDVEAIIPRERALRLLNAVCRPDELDRALECGLEHHELLTIAFSFKESIFKCVFPFVRRYFGYHDAALTAVDPRRGALEATLTIDLGHSFPVRTSFHGRFVRTETHVYTSVSLPVSASRSSARLRAAAPLIAG
jgi:4'-phosphopantetheinyl transferase EntD